MTFSIYLYSTKYLICILSFRHIVCSTDFRSADFRSKDSFRQIYFLQSRGTPLVSGGQMCIGGLKTLLIY